MTDSKECIVCLTRLEGDDVREVRLGTVLENDLVKTDVSWDLCKDCRLKLTHAMWDSIWAWRNQEIEKRNRIRDEAIEDLICH